MATDATFVQTCGACHQAYAPDLLPYASWKNILGRMEDHFGNSLEIEASELKTIMSYLENNAADRRKTELSQKIMKSLGAQVPQRITEVPYIKTKHARRKLSADCVSCHKQSK